MKQGVKREGDAAAGATPLLLHPAIGKARVLVSVAVLLGANLLPLLGVALWGWKLFDLIVIYWLETLVIGGFAIVRMALTSGWFALFSVPFFIVHFGGFMTVHFIFLTVLFGESRGVDFGRMPAMLREMITTRGLWVAVIALAASRGLGLVFRFLVPWARERWRARGATPDTAPIGELMFGPYKRVMVMHVTIIIGALLVEAYGSRIAFLVLLIVLKTATDLYVWRRERKGETLSLNRLFTAPAVAAPASVLSPPR
ncbi:MAG: DUF6498-containing protein [Xanthobacteraceae bacterium]